MKTRAALLVAHSSLLRIDDVELPEPGRGETVVEMAYGGVNPVDSYQVAGRVGGDVPLPRGLGSEGSGHVSFEDGVRRAVLVSRSSLVRRQDGIWATRVLVSTDKLVEVPAGLDLSEAACVGVAGVTAWRCVRELGEVDKDDKVLVLGASGGVGCSIVSLCHNLGAEVAAQTASEEKRVFLEARGADRVVVGDARAIAEGLESFAPSVVFDPLGGDFTAAAVELVSPRGRIVLFGTSADPTGKIPLRSLYRKAVKVLGYAGLIESPARLMEGARRALEAVAKGDMEIVVGSVAPLREVNDALSDLGGRTRQGKLVLDLQEA